MTVLCALTGALFAIAGFSIPWNAEAVAPAPGIALVFLAGILAIHVGRQRRPLTMLLLGTVVAIVEVLLTGVSGVGVLIVLSDLAYAAALYSASRVVDAVALACTALAVGCAGLIVAIWLTRGVGAIDGYGGVLLGSLITVPVLFASSIWIGRMLRYPRLEARRARERADTVERAAAALRQAAVGRERLELSRELHDVIAGHLSAIAMQSTAALERQDTDDPAPLRRSLELVRGSSLDALADMRTMIDVLRGDPSAAGVVRAPGRLTAEEVARAVAVAEANGLEVVVRAPAADVLATVPAQTSVVGLRTLVEGLTNTAKHAPGALVQVDVAIVGGLLTVSVRNPLGGSRARASVPGSGGVGLIGLGERARLVGGDLAAGSDGTAWRTVLHAPLQHPRPVSEVVQRGSVS